MTWASPSLVACSGRVVRIWDPWGAELTHTVITDEIQTNAVAWNHTGRVVAAGGKKGRITLYDDEGEKIPGA